MCEITQSSYASFISKTTIFAKLLDFLLTKPLWDSVLFIELPDPISQVKPEVHRTSKSYSQVKLLGPQNFQI